MINDQTIGTLAERLAAVIPGFDRSAFEAQANDCLEDLELKARVDQMTKAAIPEARIAVIRNGQAGAMQRPSNWLAGLTEEDVVGVRELMGVSRPGFK